MSLLHTADLRAVLDYADTAVAVEGFSDVQPVLLGRLAAAVGCEAATLTHLDLRTAHEVALIWPSDRASTVSLEAYADLGTAHPLRPVVAERLRARRLDAPPVRISDLLSRRQWCAHPLHRQVMRDVDDQMTLPLRARGSAVHAVALARSGRPFSDRQREVLHHCGRHLAAALRRVDREGQHALQIAPTVRWVPARDAPGLADLSPADRRPAGSGLTDPALNDSALPDGPAAGSALSPREREVLALVAAGLTDAQAARSLGLRSATVSKHLQRIYHRLELPNRVAAVRYWSGEAEAVRRPTGGG
jgi:DNA-binding CsgD family transcriptional regulator